jgi:hypothetical protein
MAAQPPPLLIRFIAFLDLPKEAQSAAAVPRFTNRPRQRAATQPLGL